MFVKEIDDTPIDENNESEDLAERVRELIGVVKHLQANAYGAIERLEKRIKALEVQSHITIVEVADLHHRRRVSRHQVNQDPEWFA